MHNSISFSVMAWQEARLHEPMSSTKQGRGEIIQWPGAQRVAEVQALSSHQRAVSKTPPKLNAAISCFTLFILALCIDASAKAPLRQHDAKLHFIASAYRCNGF